MKLTVLFINNSHAVLGGATRSLIDMIESLKDKVTPIVLLREKGLVYDLLTARGVECITHNYTSILRPTLKNSIIDRKAITHPWRLWPFKVLRHDYSCVRYIKKMLRGRQIDIVHTNTTVLTIGYRIARALKAKHIVHIRECLDGAYFRNDTVLMTSLAQRLIKKADARVVISNFCKEYWGFTGSNTWVLLDAVLRKEDRCFIKEKQPYYLFCSWGLSEAKGVSFAIRSFGLSRMAEKGMSLKIVGNASEAYKNNLRELASQYGCRESVLFLPEQPDVKPLFMNATAFIQPSIREGLGRVTVEAMFYGCPVLGRASGGTLDLIKDGETGYLFNTEEECAELMKTICMTDHTKLILHAQEFAINNCAIEDYGERIMGIYKIVLNNNL